MTTHADLTRVRNFGICAHIDAGKTTVSERILFYSGKEHSIGEVHEGGAKMDYLEEEQQRGITITAAATTIAWLDSTLNLIDTPGHVDFTAEVERSLRVLDGAVVVFDAVHGVEAQSETVWRQADRYRVPRICFLNKMDRGGADFDASVASIRQRLGATVLPIVVPIGSADGFEGVADLVHRQRIRFTGEHGETVLRDDWPEDRAEELEMRRAETIEALADLSDEIAERFLDGREVDAALFKRVLRRVTLETKAFPALSGAALRNAGIQPLLDAIVAYLPSPLDVGPVVGRSPDDAEVAVRLSADPSGPLAALAFKIVTEPHGDLTFVRIYSGTIASGKGLYNPRLGRHERVGRLLRMHANDREGLVSASAGEIVALVGLKETATGDTLCDKAHPIALESIRFPDPVISVAIEPKSAADREKLEEALKRLSREDPTFRVRQDAETGQTLIAGMGELHLEVLGNRLVRDFRIAANVGTPRVAYRQTVGGSAKTRHVFERLIAGKPQRADVELSVAAAPAGAGVSVKNTLGPDRLPRPFALAIEEGIRFAAEGGLDLGFPVLDVAVEVLDARVYEGESTETSFQAAAGEAFREACQRAGPVVLEPVMQFEVTTPPEHLGPVSADLVRRRAVLEGDQVHGEARVLVGKVPLGQMFGYSTAVRSLTQGRASYSMEPAGFAPVSEADRRRLTLDD